MKVTDASSGSGKWYYYEKNLQGDIVGIMNADGYKVVSYSYDAWGVPYAPVYSTDSVVSAADKANAELNPFRYRGYYYDSETGYYYLQTRYYNPEWGRFINADGYINANGDIIGYNMFAYCFNNPANLNDYTGEWPKWLSGALNIAGGALQVAAGAALGATVGWTGLGAVAAGFLVVNGITTGIQMKHMSMMDMQMLRNFLSDITPKTIVRGQVNSLRSAGIMRFGVRMKFL